jgi:hypothetical protein
MSAGERAGVAPVPAADARWVELLGPAHLLAGTPLVPLAIVKGATLCTVVEALAAARPGLVGLVLDSLIRCKFLRPCFDELDGEAAALSTLVTGWPLSGEGLPQAGARVNTLQKLCNSHEGWTRADATLPARCLDEALVDGPGRGERLRRAELAEMIAGYYAARGWTADGQVPTATLRALGLEELAGAEGPTAEDGVAPRCGVGYG